MQNESVVLSKGKRIGGEFVQRRIAQPQWGLHLAPLLLLAQDIGDVVGAKSARGVGFGDGGGDRCGAIFTNQGKQFADLPRQRTVGIGETFEIFVGSRAEQRDQALLGS